MNNWREKNLAREMREGQLGENVCPGCKTEVEELLVIKVQRKVPGGKENITELKRCPRCVKRWLNVDVH